MIQIFRIRKKSTKNVSGCKFGQRKIFFCRPGAIAVVDIILLPSTLPACFLRLFVAVSALLELCYSSIQFAFCGCFRRVFFRQGIVFCIRSILLCVAFSWRLPWVSPSCVLFSPLWAFPSVRDDLVTACLSAVRFCLFSAFRLARGFLYPLRVSLPFWGVFGVLSVNPAGVLYHFIISPPPCIRQPIA